MAGQNSIGLDRREMEREVAWALREVPEDPKKFAKVIGNLMINLLEKNNRAIDRAFTELNHTNSL